MRALSLRLMTPWASIRLYEYQLANLELYSQILKNIEQ
ncbi:hypothetical protein J504_2838 [Acinetobacter baumannii 348935]|nr:hypothetical protein J504_2838 [Acinetobacter baumannii 348935]